MLNISPHSTHFCCHALIFFLSFNLEGGSQNFVHNLKWAISYKMLQTPELVDKQKMNWHQVLLKGMNKGYLGHLILSYLDKRLNSFLKQKCHTFTCFSL